MTRDELLAKLEGVKPGKKGEAFALCPAHPDRKTPSLHITEAQDRLLLKCMAGCSTEAVVEALGITMADLFTEPLKEADKKIIATYDYQAEDGSLLFQVVRYEPKSFAQRHKNSSGEWVWNMTDVRRVLYHLPEILIEPGTIFFVEGEKDADNLWAWGQVATTSPGGSNNWKPEYANYLVGKKVVIIPDNDSAGLAYGRQVAKSLQGKVASLNCILLTGAKDISEWLEQGQDIAELPAMTKDIASLFITSQPNYQREDDIVTWYKDDYIYQAQNITKERTGIHARLSISFNHEVLNWSVLNIERAEDRIRFANAAYEMLKRFLS